MKNRSTRRRAALPALLALAAVLLSGCQMRIGADVAAEGTMSLSVAIIDDDGMFDTFEMSCSDFNEQADAGDEIGEFTETEIDGYRACVATSDPVTPDGEMFRDNGETYSVVLDGLGELNDDMSEDLPAGTIDLQLTVTMPGSIIEYTEGGVLADTTVTYALDAVPSTVVVTGLKSGQSANPPLALADGEGPGKASASGQQSIQATPEAPTAEPSDEPEGNSPSPSSEGKARSGEIGDEADEDSSGSLGAVTLGLGLALAAGLAAWLTFRSRRTMKEATQPDGHGTNPPDQWPQPANFPPQ